MVVVGVAVPGGAGAAVAGAARVYCSSVHYREQRSRIH